MEKHVDDAKLEMRLEKKRKKRKEEKRKHRETPRLMLILPGCAPGSTEPAPSGPTMVKILSTCC